MWQGPGQPSGRALRHGTALLSTVLVCVLQAVIGWELSVVPSDRMIEQAAQTNVTLVCRALGLSNDDNPKLYWRDNNEQNITALSGQLFVEKSSASNKVLTLRIVGLKATLTGWYTCAGTAQGQTNSAGRLVTISGAPQFVKDSHKGTTSVNATIGLSIALRCQVLHQGSHAVNWYYEPHHQQLSSNKRILIESKRHSIVFPIGDMLGNSYNLQITNISAADAGVYKCQINDTNLMQTTKITVINAPVIKKPRIPPANFTDCCKKNGVSSQCLPVCDATTVDLTKFKLENCLMDIEKLLKCGSDQRNHIPCCRRRYVVEDCLDLCVPVTAPLTLAHLKCVNYSIDIFRCYEEGQFLLPSPPTKVTVGRVSDKLVVKWQPPRENADKVSGYKIFYKSDKHTDIFSTSLIGADRRTYNLTKLKPGVYQVYMIAASVHGASIPSYKTEAQIPSTENPTSPISQNGSLLACCKRKGVASTCQSYLCEGNPSEMNSNQLLSCFRDLDKVLSCVGGERNHTSCCVKNKVPNGCLPMCVGKSPPDSFSVIYCFSYISEISSCFQSGRSELPTPPGDVTVSNVKQKSATVSWLPVSRATSYIVTYTDKSLSGTATMYNKIFNGSSYAMLNLQPSHQYEVTVTSVNDKGSSLPSQPLIFFTNAKKKKVPTATLR